MPVFAARADGGIVVDVDGNHLIDLGSGIAVTTVGNSAPRVVAAVATQVEHFTHTCFMVTPYEGYVAVAETLNRLHPRRAREADRAVQLRRRGGRERREDRPGAYRAGCGGGLRPRLPRPHQPHDGDDREEHAVQARLRAVRPRGLPGAGVLPVPRRQGARRADRRGARDRPDGEAGRRRRTSRPRHRADPGRGRLHRAGARLPARACRVVPEQRRRLRRRRGADRLRPDRGPVRVRARAGRARPDRHREGHRGRPAAVGGHRTRRDHGCPPRWRPGRHLRRQPARLRCRARRDRDHRGRRPGGPRARIERR